MANKQLPNIKIENAEIRFRNFQGAAKPPYNAKGERNFCVLIDDQLAEQLKRDDWNVKYLKPREDGDRPQAYLQVKVVFGTRPPNVVLVTSRGRTNLGEDELMVLDFADIRTIDMIIRPYEWEVGGKSGVSAYLKSIFVTINEDELDLKYANVPDANAPMSGAVAMSMRDGFLEEDNPPWN